MKKKIETENNIDQIRENFQFSQMSKYCCGGCGVGPDEEEKQRRKQHKKIEEELVKDRRKYKATQRLLLLGKY